MVLRARLELARLSALDPKSSAAANYATSALNAAKTAKIEFIGFRIKSLVREKQEVTTDGREPRINTNQHENHTKPPANNPAKQKLLWEVFSLVFLKRAVVVFYLGNAYRQFFFQPRGFVLSFQ